MKKVNSVVYHKLIIQAKEAKVQNLEKLSTGILTAMGPMPEDEQVHYDYQQLQTEVYNEMWKMTTHVIKYYDVNSADAGKLHDRLEVLAEKFIQEVERSLSVDNVVTGPLESLLPGEMKVVASKVYRDKKNGYIDLVDGTWGVIVYSAKDIPKPGDRVWIDLSGMGDPSLSSQEEIISQVLRLARNSKNQVAYQCSIQSQDDAERILGGKPQTN